MKAFASFLQIALLLRSLPSSTYAAPLASAAGPVVTLGYGSFQGTVDGNIAKFLGMPFAAPPVGNLRFAPAQAPVAFTGTRQATDYGFACPEQEETLTILPSLNISVDVGALLSSPKTASEDCLFVNVIKPASIADGTKLPVVFWIFGGGFEGGDTSSNPGDPVVNRAIALNEPIIYVSANYRTNAFGFLGGKEAQANGAGNIGLKDQRFALQWVQQNIATFGGDPQKVTIWGESAGAISAALQLVAKDGNSEGLFRAAVMESGSPIPLKPIADQQPVYDQLVSDTGCGSSQDTFACLRTLPFNTLMAAINNSPNLFSYQSLMLAYQPSVDGEFIVRNPTTSISQGLYAKVPIISGDCDDEGTAFSLSNLNVSNEAEFRQYISTVYLVGATDAQLDAVASAYPADITQGSPFDTGILNAPTAEFKRLAAFQGDLVFQAPRRFFLTAAAKTQPTYGFLYKRDKVVPFLGSFHSSDLDEFYGSGTLPDNIGTDALVNFVNNLNPNSPKNINSLLSLTNWPLYSSSSTSPPLFTFVDPAPLVEITADTFRASALQTLTDLSIQLYPA
ncbi:carotenoid ester lipase precursor [Cyathus striatus]|nr:carotenoid ester lipase precursor [Cyathus striatus]